MIKIVHFSDWHLLGPTDRKLPEADLYVCTGDMLPNFPVLNTRGGIGRTLGRWIINPDNEKQKQEEWIQKVGSISNIFGTPDAPVVVVRGNHDFTDLAPLFSGSKVYEIGNDASVAHEVIGLRIGGCRGIPYIVGFWSDELSDADFDDRVRKLPNDLDLIVTHSPPQGCLDQFPPGVSLGSRALAGHLLRSNIIGRAPRAVMFGHIHESCGKGYYGSTVVSNAATTVNVIEIDAEEEIEDVDESHRAQG
jgi:Icc-related predicted phosphoesterase